MRGYYAEGRTWLVEALDRDTPRGKSANREHALLRARALLLLGRLVVAQDEYSKGREIFEQVLEIGQATDDNVTQAYAMCHTGWIDVLMREYARARSLIDRGLGLFEASGETWGPIEGYNFKAMCAQGEGKYDETARAYGESVRLATAAGDPWQEGLALLLWGELDLIQKDYTAGRSLLESALARGRDLSDKWMVEGALVGVSHALLVEGKTTEAVPLIKEALLLSDSLGYPRGIGSALTRLAWAAGLQRQFSLMARLLGAGMAKLREKQIAISTMLAEQIGPLQEVASKELGESAWEAEVAAGSAVPSRKAIRYALEKVTG